MVYYGVSDIKAHWLVRKPTAAESGKIYAKNHCQRFYDFSGSVGANPRNITYSVLSAIAYRSYYQPVKQGISLTEAVTDALSVEASRGVYSGVWYSNLFVHLATLDVYSPPCKGQMMVVSNKPIEEKIAGCVGVTPRNIWVWARHFR